MKVWKKLFLVLALAAVPAAAWAVKTGDSCCCGDDCTCGDCGCAK